MIEDFGKKEIVGLQPDFDLFRSAHNQIDRDARIEPAEDFGGFPGSGASVPKNDQHIHVGIRPRVAIRIGTEQDYPLGPEFRRNAIPQIQDALLVDHS
jgi:hypothetical protein